MKRILFSVLTATTLAACSKAANAPGGAVVTMPPVRHAVTHAQELDGHGCMYLGCTYERGSSTGFEQEPCACDDRLVGAPLVATIVASAKDKATIEVQNQSTERIRLVSGAMLAAGDSASAVPASLSFDATSEVGEIAPGAARRIEVAVAPALVGKPLTFRAEMWCWHQEGQCYELKRPAPEEHAAR